MGEKQDGCVWERSTHEELVGGSDVRQCASRNFTEALKAARPHGNGPNLVLPVLDFADLRHIVSLLCDLATISEGMKQGEKDHFHQAPVLQAVEVGSTLPRELVLCAGNAVIRPSAEPRRRQRMN